MAQLTALRRGAPKAKSRPRPRSRSELQINASHSMATTNDVPDGNGIDMGFLRN